MGIAAAPSTSAFEALVRGRQRLLSLQEEGGWWRGELETNVTMDAEDLLLRQFLGITDPGKLERAANWIRSQQRDDGTWANFHGAPGDLSTTVEAYAALRLAGDDRDADHMRRAAEFVLDSGGLEASRVFTRIWLALFGLWRWEDLPAQPPEMILLPPWFPLNAYDFACWARQTVVALTVVYAELRHRPDRAASLPFDLAELRTGRIPELRPESLAGRALTWLDRGLHLYERRPVGRLRRAALERAERWIVDRQEADGSWGGIQPPWVYSLLALHLRGYPLDHPVMKRGLDGIETFAIEEGDVRRLEACQSPVWDTALAMLALSDAGAGADDPALERGARWLLENEVRVKGDWAVRRPDLEPGSWAFEFANVNYPDIDDTAVVALALRRSAVADHGALERANRWLLGMQSSDGGWGAFDADNVRGICRDLPFCDFGEVIDPPSADVTAHAVELFADAGLAGEPAVRRGVDWLLANQEPGGSWFGRWGVNHVYGTGAVVPALVAAGVPASDASIRRAVAWLERVQNSDGGWGEDARSYDDPGWIGRGESTASQTAWALLALHAAGEAGGDAAGRGIDWLARTQRPDGGWDEPQYTGTGFPGHFYINYHLYRDVFPVMALGRCLGGGGEG